MVVFCLGKAHLSNAQQHFGNQHCKWVKYTENAFALDTTSILPQSLQVMSSQGQNYQVAYDLSTNQTKIIKNSNDTIAPDSLLICYQTLPFNIAKPFYKRDVKKYDSIKYYRDRFYKPPTSIGEKREELFATDGLQKTGSITRGISVGNTQNVFVNSALNLQLEGQLTNDIRITAAISDQSVPFQPEGNTQQLQEFDKVFIQLSHKLGNLTVGDIVMRNKESNFLRYYKNVQGGQVEAIYELNKKSKAQTTAGAAIAKGKFASIVIPTLEGVQGPYRLQGPNNERFIIILANAEKVFLDGRLLQRGFNYDYVIDYNQAEITFTNRIVITQFSRIRVDFEYSERNYSRINAQASHYQNYEKVNFAFNYYSETDNPRNPLTLTLTEQDKISLSQIGDDTQNAFVNSVDSIETYNPNLILYKRIDSTINNIVYKTVYVYSTEASNAFYQINFTEIGLNKGNYILENTTANGRIFKWVEPINGIPQGRFEPIQIIPTPTKKQMITLGSAYNFSENDKIYIETAFSEKDLNRFSTLGDDDNQGYAIKGGYLNKGRNVSFSKKYQILGNLDFEYDQARFSYIDRFRDIEYNRDWSLATDTTKIADKILSAGIGFKKDALNQVLYNATYRQRGTEVDGLQQKFTFNQDLKHLRFLSQGFLLDSKQGINQSTWQRVQADVAYKTAWFVPGYVFTLDKNAIKNIAKDSVIATAMNFEEHKAYLKTNDSLATKLTLDYALRQDYAPLNGELKRRFSAHTANISLQRQFLDQHQIGITGTYRKVENLTALIATEKYDENIMSRLDWNSFFLKKIIRSELTWAIATGRELRKEYVFLPVATGEGTHIWRDDNKDGVQDLSEFYLAINPDERKFVKIFVPTDQYIKAFTNNFNYRLNIEAPAAWKEKAWFLKQLSKFSNTSSWSLNRKITDDNLWNRISPLSVQLAADKILSSQDALRSTLFYNRTNPQYGWDINYLRTQQKQLLTNGFESRAQQEWGQTIRTNLYKIFNARIGAVQGNLANSSDFLLNRNYQIAYYKVTPELAFQPSSTVRFSTNYTYGYKKNNSESQEQALLQQIGVEARWNKLSQRNLIATAKVVNIFYTGAPNTPVSYEMLEALQVGVNWVWSINWQQRLANGLQLTFNYEGRKSPTIPVIHIGRMQIAALF